jgi:hypothetical protein
MTAHGAPRGLLNYWENKITVPIEPIPAAAALTPGTTTTTPITPTQSTPLHSLTPLFLEYQLRESIALSSILINLIDIPGTGINPKGKSHEAWTLLKEQYGKPSERTRNMRET